MLSGVQELRSLAETVEPPPPAQEGAHAGAARREASVQKAVPLMEVGARPVTRKGVADVVTR